MEIIELLQRLGFSEYEARVYVALLQHNPMNGYAVAKQSGIPRANVYAVLQKLTDRGAVVPVENDDGAEYVPIPPNTLIQRLGDEFTETLDSARDLLAAAGNVVEVDYVENIQGHRQLMRHAHDLIERASKELLIAVWEPEARLLADVTAEADMRGVEITTLCFQACPHECGGCGGHVYRYGMSLNHNSRTLIVIADGAEMLFGSLRGGRITDGQIADGQIAANRTRQQQLIEMTSWYIRHSIAAAALLTDVGDNLNTLLRPETRMILQSVGPGLGWIEAVQSLLSKNNQQNGS